MLEYYAVGFKEHHYNGFRLDEGIAELFETFRISRMHLNLDSETPQIVCVLSCFSHVQLFATLWTVARQAPLSMGFSRQEYWSRLPFASPGDLPNPGIEPGSPALQTDALPSESLEALMLNNDLNVTLTILRTLLFLWITKYKLDYFYYLFIYF